jgi:hypothetical protein
VYSFPAADTRGVAGKPRGRQVLRSIQEFILDRCAMMTVAYAQLTSLQCYALNKQAGSQAPEPVCLPVTAGVRAQGQACHQVCRRCRRA